jgi:hypothetical protein
MTEQAIRPSVTTPAIGPSRQGATCAGHALCRGPCAYGRADNG